MWSAPYFNTHTLWCLQDGYLDIDHSLYCIIKQWTLAGVIFVPLGTAGNVWRHFWLWQLGVVLLVSSCLQSPGKPPTHHKQVTAPNYNTIVTRTNTQKFIPMCYSSGCNKEGELRLTVHNCFYGQFNPGIYSTFGHSEPIFIKFSFWSHPFIHSKIFFMPFQANVGRFLCIIKIKYKV